VSLGKSDCTAEYQPGSAPLDVRIVSTVEALFGRAIAATARSVAEAAGITTGRITIDDNGSLDHVVAARVEAALRAAGSRVDAAVTAPVPGTRSDRRRRSRLYVPGNQPDLFPNAGLFGADVVILDLEDSVPPACKAQARILVRRTLEAHTDFFGSSEIAVRINPLAGPYGREDLAELGRCLPPVLVIPKCEAPADVLALGEALGRYEESAGRPSGSTLVLPLVETARGVLAAAAIAGSSPRVAGLCFGAEDFCTDIGARRTEAGTETLYARSLVVLAARAAGVQALDSVFSDVEDEQGFASYCAASRGLGFDGVGVLHPLQIETAHREFAPTDAEVEEARRIVACLEEAESEGRGVAAMGGKMIDAPVAARARRILTLVGEKGR
jgi:citrate lyase subunit beta / citryl-CoA lyase